MSPIYAYKTPPASAVWYFTFNLRRDSEYSIPKTLTLEQH